MHLRFTSPLALCLLAALAPAHADMSAPIAGSAPIIPAFTAAPTRSAPAAITTSIEARLAEEAQSLAAPLFERRLSARERSADLAPDLAEAILRIEGVYDPARAGAGGDAPPMSVFAGTASMGNVFGERWHIGDTDATVSYAVRYIAEAWQKGDAEPCIAYRKHRPSESIVEVTALGAGDCARIEGLRGAQESLLTHLTIVQAWLSVPVFAAPQPGARMTPEAFWTAQKARVEAIRARIQFQRRRQRRRSRRAANRSRLRSRRDRWRDAPRVG